MDEKLINQVEAKKLVQIGQAVGLELVQCEVGRRNKPLFLVYLVLDNGERKQMALARGGPKKVYCSGGIALATELDFERVMFRLKNGL